MTKVFPRFALGMRVVDSPEHPMPPKDFLNILFFALSPADADDLVLYICGTPENVCDPEPVYIVVLSNMSIKRSKRLFQTRILRNMTIRSYLSIYRPFVQNNYLEKCKDTRYIGRVSSDGYVRGGEITIGNMRFIAPLPKETLTIRLGFLLAPCAYPGLSPAEAGRCLTRAVASRFPEAIVESYPLASGVGILDAFIFHRGGRYVSCTVHDRNGIETEAKYGILSDYSAVIESSKIRAATSSELDGDTDKSGSYGAGELLLHALTAKCRRIYIGLDRMVFSDSGDGFMRALGMQKADDGERILVDASLVHPQLKETTIVILSDFQADGNDPTGIARRLLPFAHVEEASAVETLLQLGSFDRRLRDMAIVFSGIGVAADDPVARNVMHRIEAHCKKNFKQLVQVCMPEQNDAEKAEKAFEQAALSEIARMKFENWFIAMTSELVPVSGDQRIGKR